jgi:hypothetical protein
MKNAQNLNRIQLDLIPNDVRQCSEGKLRPSSHSAAGSSKIGKILQAGALVIDRIGNAAGRFGIVPFNPISKCSLNPQRRQGPANLHQGLQEQFQALAHLLMGKILVPL